MGTTEGRVGEGKEKEDAREGEGLVEEDVEEYRWTCASCAWAVRGDVENCSPRTGADARIEGEDGLGLGTGERGASGEEPTGTDGSRSEYAGGSASGLKLALSRSSLGSFSLLVPTPEIML